MKELGGTLDLLMMDAVMPGMNDLNFAMELSSPGPGIKRLFTSVDTNDIIASHGVSEKDLQFLVKPYTPQSLDQRTRGALAG